MIKTTILASIILFSATMMVQEVSSEEDIPFPIQHGGTGQAIPDWIKTQFEWYINGETDEKTLLTSMNWMFDNNIMHLSEEAAQEVQEMRNEIDDLKYELEVTKAAIAIPNLLDARKSGNESSDTGSGIGDASMTDEFGRIKVQFPWGSNQADIDQFIDEMKKSIDDLPPEQQSSAISSLRTIVTTQTIDSSGTGTSDNEWRVKKFLIGSSESTTFVSDTIDDIMTKGGTTSAWEDGIAAFAEHGMHASVADDLQAIVVLCNTQIDKKTQSINAELKIIEKWLEIIEEKQTTNTSSTDYYGRAEPTSNYNESDLDFISRQLVHIDQQINSLDTGIKVLEDKLESVGDDAQLANIDLQNQLQKQQKTIQSMSDDSKMLHDTAMSVIRKIG